MNVPCGHVLPTLALPMGRLCTLNADEGTITLEKE
jgi:muramoyltetrapeptide carboxypeptidase LdcA involved in peptidoglycan recycling